MVSVQTETVDLSRLSLKLFALNIKFEEKKRVSRSRMNLFVSSFDFVETERAFSLSSASLKLFALDVDFVETERVDLSLFRLKPFAVDVAFVKKTKVDLSWLRASCFGR